MNSTSIRNSICGSVRNREEPIALMKDSKSNDKDEGKDYCCATWWKADEISVGEKVQFHNGGFVIAGLIIGPIVTQKEVRVKTFIASCSRCNAKRDILT